MFFLQIFQTFSLVSNIKFFEVHEKKKPKFFFSKKGGETLTDYTFNVSFKYHANRIYDVKGMTW